MQWDIGSWAPHKVSPRQIDPGVLNWEWPINFGDPGYHASGRCLVTLDTMHQGRWERDEHAIHIRK